MDCQKNKAKCSEHNLEFIIVNLNSQSKLFNRKYCLKCLTEEIRFQNLVLIKDAEKQLQQNMVVFKQKKLEQGQENIKILNKLAENIKSMIEQLEQMRAVILQKNEEIQKSIDQIKEQLNDIDIDKVITQSNDFIASDINYEEMNRMLKDQFLKLKDFSLIKECIQLLNSFDKQKITLFSEIKQIEEQEIKKDQSFKCVTHNEELILYDLNVIESKENRLLCIECIHQKEGKYQSLVKIKKQWFNQQSDFKQKIIDLQEQIKKKQNGIYESCYTLKESFSQNIDAILYLVIQKTQIQQDSIKQILKQQNRNWQTLSKEEIIEIASKFNDSQQESNSTYFIGQEMFNCNKDLDFQIKDCIINLKETELNFFFQLGQIVDLKEIVSFETKGDSTEIGICSEFINANYEEKRFAINLVVSQVSFIQKHISVINTEIEQLSQPVTPNNYSIITDSLDYGENICRALAINRECNKMAASQGKSIKIFMFIWGQLKEIQTLQVGCNEVYVLLFMKNSNHLISGDAMSAISLWGIKCNNQYELIQQFKDGHTSTEDMIISGSWDQTIKFWSKKLEWVCNQSLNEHKSRVVSISLSETEKQLISCGGDSKILIIEKQSNDIWQVIQAIDGYGYKVHFIDDQTFIFQVSQGRKMHIYEYLQQNKKYSNTKEILFEQSDQDSEFFPSIFNKEKQALLHRCGNIVYLMKRNIRGEFSIVYSLKFDARPVYGTITNDWEYLVTWNNKKIEVRKQQKC